MPARSLPTLSAALLLLAASPTMAADTLFASSFRADGSIQRFDLPSPVPTTIVVGLEGPEDGACHPDGRIYFAESLAGRVTRWEQDGSDLTPIVPEAGRIFGPEGLAFDTDGNLYMNTRGIGSTARGAWRLAGGDPSNAVEPIVPPFTDFGEGSAIVEDGAHAGALLLVDRDRSRVWISEPPGAAPRVFIDSSAFPDPSALFGIVTDGCGNILVTANEDGTDGEASILLFGPEGEPLGVYADSHDGERLRGLGFLELDSEGNLYVASGYSNTIYRVRPDRTVEVFAPLVEGLGLAICREGAGPPPCLTGRLTCDAGGPYERECTGSLGGTRVELDGSGSRGSQGGELAYAWTTDCPGSLSDASAERPELLVEGAHCDLRCGVELVVTDEAGESEACSAAVRVADTTPPELDGSAEGLFDLALWPPNHGYAVFDPVELVPATDACGEVAVLVEGCASNQPEEVHGKTSSDGGGGDGRFSEDCVLATDGTLFAVRSERLGACGPDAVRVYRLAVVAQDACGNRREGSGTIRVDHDRSAERTDVLPPPLLAPQDPPPFPYHHPTTYGTGCGEGGR